MRKIALLGVAVMLLSAPGCAGGGGGKSKKSSRPEGVTALAGDAEVIITWQPMAKADSFDIYWDNSPGVTFTNGTRIPNVTSPHTHGALANGTTYYYVVVAVRGAQPGPESAEVAATPISAPMDLTAAPGDMEISLAWLPVVGASSYDVYWDNVPGVSRTSGSRIAGVTSGYVHAGLANGTSHYYVVTAVTPTGAGPESSEASATPGSIVATVNIGGTTVSFVGATHYYDPVFDESGILLDRSNPPDWKIDLFWDFDVDPGCPYDSCNDFLLVDVFEPGGAWYWETSCVTDVTLCITQYSATPGGQTTGTFSGAVENSIPPFDVMNLTGGQFAALRQ